MMSLASGPISIAETVDIGYGRGRLAPNPAASVLRIDAQLRAAGLADYADVNDAWRSPEQADENRRRWLAYQNGTGPAAPYALDRWGSIHCRGYAKDSDDWYNSAKAAILRRNGWRQTALYPVGDSRREEWHGEYDESLDEYLGQPAGSTASDFPIARKPKEYPDMRLIKITKDGATTYALIGTRFFQSTVDVGQANGWAESWGDAREVSQRAWDEAINAAAPLMSEELPPSLFKILREDNQTLRNELNGRLDGLARDMITSALFTAYQQSQTGVDSRQDARILQLETDRDQGERDLRQVLEAQNKSKAQLLTAIGLSVFASVLTVIGGVVLWTLQQGLTQLAGAGG